MDLDVYQMLRATQAVIAALGIWLSGVNLYEACQDQQWLLRSRLNGLRAITASSLVVHEAGRLAMQIVLCLIGVLGLALDGGSGSFDNWETLLDTLVVVIVVLVSWHSRYVRVAIRQWRHDVHVGDRP